MSYLKRPFANGHFHPAASNYFNAEPLASTKNAYIDLNEVFCEAVQQFEEERSRRSIIIRCDHLPSAMIDQQHVLHIFTELIGMIVRHSPIGNDLFLYIKSSATNAESIVKTSMMHASAFEIQFFTNVAVDADWYNLYHQKLEEISIAITSFKGRFVYNNTGGVSCLFCITLPGKLSV